MSEKKLWNAISTFYIYLESKRIYRCHGNWFVASDKFAKGSALPWTKYQTQLINYDDPIQRIVLAGGLFVSSLAI